MRVTFVLFIVFLLSAHTRGYTQSISFSGDNVSLEKIFKEIERQTGYGVTYKEAVLSGAKLVTVKVRNMPLEEFLKLILKGQGIEYLVRSRTVLLSLKRNDSEKENRDIAEDGSLIKLTGTVLGNNQLLAGAIIRVKGKNINVVTNDNGYFELTAEMGSTLIISYVGFQQQEYKVNGGDGLIIKLVQMELGMDTAEVVLNTGYQKLPKERSTGSFTFVDSALFNRAVGSNVLSRLEGVAAGVQFIKGQRPGTNERVGISIRGRSTLDDKVSADPLIVLDNFPYEGGLDNINPNDIDNITILKDAAAASIWGARSGNGVIVITTKRGSLNKKMQITFNANASLSGKPDLNSQKLLSSSDFIEVEKYLFDNGYFNSDLTNKSTRPPVSPAVEILGKLRNNLISQSEADASLNKLRSTAGLDDQQKYLYRTAQLQQYSVALKGGTSNSTYYLSAGFDKNTATLQGNESNRFTLSSIGSYIPVKNLTLTAKITYAYTRSLNNSLPSSQVGGKYGNLLPYSKLADENGNPVAVLKDYRESFVDSVRNLGYLDWRYRPLDELRLSDNTSRLTHFVIGTQAKYQIIPDLAVEIDYQNERQITAGRKYQSIETYYTRNLINRYSVRNATTGLFTYPFSKGGVLDLSQNELTSNNLRTSLLFNKSFNSVHTVAVLLGAERRETKTSGYSRRSYGYDDEFGTAVSVINYTTALPLFPSGSARIPGIDGSVSGVTDRFISYFGNLSYTYQEKYTATLSGRKDGANLFGVKTNDKFTPLWSAGVKWAIDQEEFFHSNLISNLCLRATYGFNGNVYNAPAYLIAYYTSLQSLTGNPYAIVSDPPNPSLRWEKVRNINIGIDYGLRKDILSGSIEFYQKDGTDLIEGVPLAPSTGFTIFKGNAAATRTKGIDLAIHSNIIINTKLKWQTAFLLHFIKDKVVNYDPQAYAEGLTSKMSTLYPAVGKPVFSVFSYKWAGLDPTNGDPQGYDEKGDITKDYTNIYRNTTVENLKFHGSARPNTFGSLRNTFYYNNLQLSFNILYSLGYYFRRNTIELNYTTILKNLPGGADYKNRWTKTGDESFTQIPSLTYPNDDFRNSFYQSSEILVERGDNIRLQDVQVTYTIDRRVLVKMPMQSLQVYIYSSNLGVIWKANNHGIDPDYVNGLRPPFSFAFGVKANL